MSQLYGRLGSLGFPRKYLRDVVLPSWWEDEIAHNPTGYAEGLAVLSRNLGLDLKSLQNESVPIGLRNLGPCKFKKKKTTNETDLVISQAVATSVARLIMRAVPEPKLSLGSSALAIRASILQRGARWVGLTDLVQYCWFVGIPIIHVASLPENAKKMDGAAWVNLDRQAIILCKKTPFSAWLLFILAHELGHIVLKHLDAQGILVDEEIDRHSSDHEERAANEFALELLTGRPDCKVFGVGRAPSARSLVNAAIEAGKHE